MAIDMVEHLGTLEKYAKECASVVECGVRWADPESSSFALLRGVQNWHIGVDINPAPVEALEKLAEELGKQYKFVRGSTLDLDFPERDLLFLDTLHTGAQLYQELCLHSMKTRKYIIMHDTETFGTAGEDGSRPGLTAAIFKFLSETADWRVHKHYVNCNGLTVLRRM